MSLFLSNTTKAQADGETLMFEKRIFKDEVINSLKNTTTVFFCKTNKKEFDSLKTVITKAWDLTPLIFDDIDNYDKYAGNPLFSYFDIEGVVTTGYGTTTNYYIALKLFKDVSRKGKISRDGLCRIELYPNFETLMAGERKKKGDVINYLYDNGVFYNWQPILLEAQIANVCTNLKKNHLRPWLFQSIRDKNLSEILSNDTLYVPGNLLMGFKAFTGKERKLEDNIFANYKHPYRICTSEELYDIFENQKRGRLLFEYVKSSADKFVTIYDLKEKTVVYKNYVPLSYNLKSKDIDKIDK